MKKTIIIFLFLLTSFSAFAQKQHVVLISIDGLRPEMYLDKSWPAPNLQRLMLQGTYADHMKSVFPAYTYPSHVAMLTGALPARSKIVFNQPKNSKGEWNWFLKDVKSPTLWQALKAKGLTTAAVEWPVSVGDDITYNIPEIWRLATPDDRIFESRKYATKGLVEEIEQNLTGDLSVFNMSEDNLSLDTNSAKIAAYIFKKYQPSLLAVHFAEVDGFAHEEGRDGPKVRKALTSVDQAVGTLISAIENSPQKNNTTILIVGDHGFSDVKENFRPNNLVEGNKGAFIAAGGSAFLYSYTITPKAEEPVLVQAVKDSLGKLPAAQRAQFRIIERPELDRMGVDSNALLGLAAKPGLVFNSGKGGETFYPGHGGHHGYDPNEPQMYTGFIAYGSGIQQGGKIDELTVTDIAPLIAKLLNIKFITPDGHLVPGILK